MDSVVIFDLATNIGQTTPPSNLSLLCEHFHFCNIPCRMMVLVLWLCLSIQQCSAVVVPCQDQQEVCQCGQSKCEFTLRIEELQTFTSYEIDHGTELTRGTPGNVYYLNGSGYIPAPTNTGTAGLDAKRCTVYWTRKTSPANVAAFP